MVEYQEQGATAVGSDRKRMWRLAWALATTDFKLKFFGSVLGYLWQLMRPLMLFGVLYFVFSTFLDVGAGAKYYPVALLLGIVLYSFFNEATSQGLRSLLARENLMRKIAFPRLAVPLASVLTASFNVVLNLVPVFVFLLAAGAPPRWSWLQLPLLMAALVFLVLGLAMLLSALFVRYRDVEPIWDVILQMLFYGTPIFYTLEIVVEKAGEGVAQALMFNPFAAILQQARHAVIDPSYDNAAVAIGGGLWIAVPILIGVAIFVLGAFAFAREAPRVAEHL
jgi:ABC-2 type transport system permease protein